MGIGRTLALVASATASFLVSAILILIGASVTELLPGSLRGSMIPVYLLIQVGIPATVAVSLGRRLARRWRPEAALRPRWHHKTPARWALAVCYGLTLAFGVPFVQSEQVDWAISEYKRGHEGTVLHAGPGLPRIRCFAALPLLPGVILTYHEYQVGGVYGLGTFELYGWYGVGSKSFAQFPLWIS